MSGGSMDYLSYRVMDVATELCCKNQNPLRRGFGAKLILIAKALHAIEWVDSGDTTEDSEAIRIALGDDAENLEFEVLLEDARALLVLLEDYTQK